ncbi:Hsp70 family protein [Stigmatella sp. ncwal1]|uniref:Hsp70 family protein n=1 Tax=Stigmatella ashevillensis TaxID=2995309 RepID=A0ABT5DLA7_9BACT|nr:Hsp70 family protein [Stigmatella ashevillena]MDC0713146.1 Hsp70 family protein [Stigmatella ashevillena]
MSAAFGIDLGTTNSVISHLVDGRPVALPIDGSPIVPSVALYTDEGTIVGRQARNLELQMPERCVHSVKRKMGTPYLYTLAGRELSPEQVSADILAALKQGAEEATGGPVRDVVITVPAYFDDAQRRATLDAGERAGLHVLRLLNEPTSASLVYDRLLPPEAESAAEPEILLIYDLGGGTFDVSVLEVFQGVREVRATTGNTHLGGDDFDEKLVQHFLDELARNQGVDPRQDARAMARLRRLAEETKIRLSSEVSVNVREEFLTQAQGKPIHLELEVRRRTFESLIEPLLESTMLLARQALQDARVEGQALSRVCLVGGSTRIPRVRQLLEKVFGVDIHEEVDPDLAVGLGAAIQAGLLTGEPVERILVDVTSHSLGMRVFGEADELRAEPDTFAPVIRRNTALPTVRVEEFYTMVPEQELMAVEVFQGEASRASENTRIGAFGFPLEPRPVNSPVRVEFSYDLNGVVKVSISQPGTANAKTVALAVADVGKATQAQAAQGAVIRKGRALLERLSPGPRAELERLLDAHSAAEGAGRDRAEDALLDFFLENEPQQPEP